MSTRCMFLCVKLWKRRFNAQRSISLSACLWQNHYDVLGIAKDASLEEVKSAFIHKSKLYHPDRHQGDQIMNDKFIQVTEAYNVLSDPEERALYNYELTRGAPLKSPNVARRSKDYRSPYQNDKGFTTDWSDYYSTYGGGKAERDMKRDVNSQFWKDYWEHTKKYGGGEMQDSMSPPPNSTVEIEVIALSAILFIVFLLAFFHSSIKEGGVDHDRFDSEHLNWLEQKRRKQ